MTVITDLRGWLAPATVAVIGCGEPRSPPSPAVGFVQKSSFREPMERFLPRDAGEVATPDLIRGSRRGQRMLACPLHHAAHGPPPPQCGGGTTVLLRCPFCAKPP